MKMSKKCFSKYLKFDKACVAYERGQCDMELIQVSKRLNALAI
jgi:hypothetical protein